MRKFLLAFVSLVLLSICASAQAQYGEFNVDGKKFKITSTTLRYCGDGGDGHIWSFTVYNKKKDYQLQLYITNDSHLKVAGTKMRAYNEWKHVVIEAGKEDGYAFPRVRIQERNGVYSIQVDHPYVAMDFKGPLYVTEEESRLRTY